MQDEERIKKLEARLKYYQEAHREILDILNSTAEQGDFYPEHGRFTDKEDVLRDSASRIKRIAPFQYLGFWLVDESTHDFYLAHQVPEDSAVFLGQEFSRLTDQGLITLAISGEKPVFASSSRGNERLMIQVIATSSRVRGIFMGSLRYRDNLPDATIPLIMILCYSCASSLEALELYSLLRKKNQALQERENRLANVMTAINEGIWDWHLPSGKLYFDDRYYTMAGYQPGEFPSTLEEFRKRVHPDDYPKLQLAIDQHFSGEKKQLDWVFRFLKKDGNWLWTRGRGKAIQRDEQGVPLRMVGTHTDISDRMEAEQNMLDSQKRYRMLSELTMEGIIIHKQGIVRDVNKAAVRILGYSRKEILGRDIVTLAFNSEDHGLIRENIQKEHAGPYVARGIRKDGSWFYAEIEARNFRDGNEELRVGAIRDITERKKAEQALIQSHERLETVLNSIQAMVYIVDLDNHEIIFCNEYARQEFGEIVGRRCWEVIQTDQTGPCRFCNFSGLLREDGSPGQAVSREIKDQRTGKWYDCRARAIHWTDGRIVRLQIASDITQRKLDQERLNRINTQLEKALAEKDKFFSIIAHDLKSPMSGLLSLSGMMAEDSGKWTAHEMQEAGTSLHKSAKNLFALLENLLQWSRMQR
ncbi:MAG: PAS domain S-box protein, partial [Desulfonatronovibrionaceae bacterium]